MDTPEALLVGSDGADDAAVWQLNNDCAIAATADFFAPMVDSPRDFGRIAATNALSDIYAMGARPLLALALTAMPRNKISSKDIANILAGGRETCRAAGVVIAGGHSIDTAEPLYGLAVLGQAHPNHILTNGGAKVGDTVILGKSLGVGLMSAAHKKSELTESDYAQMVESMTQLNSAGTELATIDGVHAMTDVTGFGLLGHMLEMCKASNCQAHLNSAAVPCFERARQLAQDGAATGASTRNWQSYGNDIHGNFEQWQRTLLTDPQTAGGLLIACAPTATKKVIASLRKNGSTVACVVAHMEEGNGIFIS